MMSHRISCILALALSLSSSDDLIATVLFPGTIMTKRPYSTELQIWTPEKKRESSSSRRLNVSIHDSTSFTLPRDWLVDEKIRTGGTMKGITDKYYYEPGTGRKFRSLVSVKRHLEETNYHGIGTDVSPLSINFSGVDYGRRSYVKPGSFAKTLLREPANQIVVYRKRYVPKHQVNIEKNRPLELPDGWFIKTSVRRSGHSIGKVDKYYCEQSTGRVFRSLVDVHRYLADSSVEENTTLSKLFKPAGLAQMSESDERNINNTNYMAIVPHSRYRDSYSDQSDDVLLKDLVRKSDVAPFKDTVENTDDVPIKHLIRKSADVSLKGLVRKSKGVPHKDVVKNADDLSLKKIAKKTDDTPPKNLVGKSDKVSVKNLTHEYDKVPLKDSPRKPSDAKRTTKHADKTESPATNVFSCTSNHPYKVKWVLNGPGGDDWTPFTNDTIVPATLKQEWASMFAYIVNQNNHNGSSSDALN